jgi:hypothetical protein
MAVKLQGGLGLFPVTSSLRLVVEVVFNFWTAVWRHAFPHVQLTVTRPLIIPAL